MDSKGTGNIKEGTYTSPPCWILFWVLCCSGSFPKMLYVKPPLLCKYILNITFYKGITINYEASTHAWHSALQLHNHLQQNMVSLWHFINHSFICLLRNQLFLLLPLPLFMTRFRLPLAVGFQSCYTCYPCSYTIFFCRFVVQIPPHVVFCMLIMLQKFHHSPIQCIGSNSW